MNENSLMFRELLKGLSEDEQRELLQKIIELKEEDS